MSVISVIILCFSLLGAADYLFGNRLGLGGEFKRGLSLFCPMALSMLGMLVLAPAIGAWISPVLAGLGALGLDPSIVPASLFANDMGGTALSQALCATKEMGDYNAFVVSSMMGCVISFTIPFALGLVPTARRGDFFLGTLCGIATIPVGCLLAGVMCGLSPGALLLNLLPLVLLALLVGAALLLFPKAAMRCFEVFGLFMKALAVIGLALAIFTHLSGVTVDENLDTLENAALVCVRAAVTLSGALPMMYAVTRLLRRPLTLLGGRIGINDTATLALLGSLVTNASTCGVIERMDRRGVVLNSAFAVSASFVLGSHLAYTMACDPAYVLPMAVGKLTSGIAALLLALLVLKKRPVA